MWLCRTIARSPALSSGMTDGEKIQRSVQVAFPQREVRRGDGRREPAVERLGQSQGLVHRVPAELDRDLVQPQLARVEEPQHLDPAEALLAELAKLRRAVLTQVPGVIGLLGAGWRQRQQVWRGDEGDAARRQHRLEVLENGAGVLYVLDRLQE